jgi:hypothetical protein
VIFFFVERVINRLKIAENETALCVAQGITGRTASQVFD